MYEDNRDWSMYNVQLGRRGGIISLFIDEKVLNFKKELKTANKKKFGRPYRYPTSLIEAGFNLKCLFHLGYRQLHDLMNDLCKLIKFPIPNFRTFWWRIDVMGKRNLRFNLQNGKKIDVAVDSTGLKIANDGEYRTTKYGKIKVWIKLHANVNISSNEAVNVIITKNDVGDVREFVPLVDPIRSCVGSVRADKGFDSSKNFEYCKKNGIVAVIPVKLNASPSGRGARQDAVREQLCIPPTHARLDLTDKREKRSQKQQEWKNRVGYGRRWAVEGFYSRYKRIFGEYVFSKKWENIEKEVVTKVNILNLFAVLR